MRYDGILGDGTIVGGVPCVRGTRIPVATVGMAAAGVDERELPLRPTG